MKRVWTSSVYCLYDNRLSLARRASTGQWEPVSTHIKRDEAPLNAAERAVKIHFGLDISFPPVHQFLLLGAPRGLLLYNEYFVSPKETRQSMLFLAEVDTDEVQLGSEYDDVMWVWDDSRLPKDILPQVRSAFPFAVMAAGLVRA